MIRRNCYSKIYAALSVMLLLILLCGCSNSSIAPESSESVTNNEPVSVLEPAEQPEVETKPVMQDGERFEGVIILEGMEEPVHYEHVRNDSLGVELDYDYENFVRHSESDREWFVSCWDSPENPENYLEVRYSPLDAETAAAAIGETLSKDYEINMDDSFMLDRAGHCIRIDASADIGGLTMPDQLQMVYIIPAADGCRVATAHYAIEASEGFGRRFRYMMNTFSAITVHGALSITGTWQTASVGYAADGAMAPEYYVQFTDSYIFYGHLEDGQFVLDHSDKIISLEAAPTGGIRIQAETSDGVQYTYQTCESDDTVLEYYETWLEEDFPEMYRGGASLSRIN